MSTAAYDAWAAKLNAERVVLCDLQAAKKLEGWTSDSYEATVIADGPVLYLRLGESAGTVADDEVNAANGTYAGTPTLGAAGLISDGTSVDFDGVDDRVTVADRADLDITTNITLEAWIHADSFAHAGGGDFPRIMAKGDGAGDGWHLYVDRVAGPKIKVDFNGLSVVGHSSAANVATGTTYHLVVTYDGANVRIYINGVLDSTSPATGSISTNAMSFVAGDRGDAARNWDGRIQEAVVYPVVLSLTQIEEHYALRTAASNVYRATWSRRLTSAVVPGGVVVQLDSVKQDDTTLTERASVALVAANAGSYYYDHAGSLLHVSTTTAADPDSFSFVGPVFSFTLSTAPKQFTDGPLYEPRLTDVSLPSVEAQHTDFLTGLLVFPSGEIAVNNADGFFDALATELYWEGYAATFRIGGDALAFSDYELMATMEIALQPAASDDLLRVPLRSVSGALNMELPDLLIEDIYVVEEDAAEGKYIPYSYGRVLDVPLILINRAGGAISPTQARFITAFGALDLTEVRAINRTSGASTVVPAAAYTVSMPTILITESSYSPDTYDFVADWGSTTEYIGSVVQDLLTAAGVAAADINTTSVTDADLDAPFALGIYIPEPTSITAILQPLLKSVMAYLYRATDGRWTIKVWDPSSDWANVPHIQEQEMPAFAANPEIQEPLAYKVRVRFAERIRSGAWGTENAVNTTTQYGRPFSQPLEIDTKLVNRTDADTMVERYLAIASTPTTRFDVELPTRAMTLGPLDKIRVTRARAQGGALDREPFEISAFVKRLNTQRMTATIDNQRGLGAVVKRAAADGTAAWASASEATKRTYAFAHDTATERVDAADADTYHHSEAW